MRGTRAGALWLLQPSLLLAGALPRPRVLFARRRALAPSVEGVVRHRPSAQPAAGRPPRPLRNRCFGTFGSCRKASSGTARSAAARPGPVNLVQGNLSPFFWLPALALPEAGNETGYWFWNSTPRSCSRTSSFAAAEVRGQRGLGGGGGLGAFQRSDLLVAVDADLRLGVRPAPVVERRRRARIPGLRRRRRRRPRGSSSGSSPGDTRSGSSSARSSSRSPSCRESANSLRARCWRRRRELPPAAAIALAILLPAGLVSFRFLRRPARSAPGGARRAEPHAAAPAEALSPRPGYAGNAPGRKLHGRRAGTDGQPVRDGVGGRPLCARFRRARGRVAPKAAARSPWPPRSPSRSGFRSMRAGACARGRKPFRLLGGPLPSHEDPDRARDRDRVRGGRRGLEALFRERKILRHILSAVPYGIAVPLVFLAARSYPAVPPRKPSSPRRRESKSFSRRKARRPPGSSARGGRSCRTSPRRSASRTCAAI